MRRLGVRDGVDARLLLVVVVAARAVMATISRPQRELIISSQPAFV